MPLGRSITPGLVYKIDLSKIADRENPRTVEAPITAVAILVPTVVDWGDGTSETFNSASTPWPTHTYAEGAGEVFQVVMRNATGHFPTIRIKKSSHDNYEQNIELACVSIDHFAGVQYNGIIHSAYAAFRVCANIAYIDPRVVAPNINSCGYMFYKCFGLAQSIESFCFDFVTQSTSFLVTFAGNTKLTGSPSGLLNNCESAQTFAQTFQGCTGLTGEPFVFWKADESLNTDKFPSLTAGANCYYQCSDALRAQVPTAYGGTMTVS